MYSLYIDTHSSDINICLFKDGKLLKHNTKESIMQHSVYCLPMIRETLNEFDITPNDIKEILVVNGPGSFTGVRIGITEAKVMAFSLNIPIKMLSSLWIKAVNINAEVKSISLVDKHGAFIATFDKNNNIIDDYKYVKKSEYQELNKNNIYKENVILNYEKIYEASKNIEVSLAHAIKPLYVKSVDGIDDKRN